MAISKRTYCTERAVNKQFKVLNLYKSEYQLEAAAASALVAWGRRRVEDIAK